MAKRPLFTFLLENRVRIALLKIPFRVPSSLDIVLSEALPYGTHIAQYIEQFALCFVLCVFARPYGCTFSSAESQYFDII